MTRLPNWIFIAGGAFIRAPALWEIETRVVGWPIGTFVRGDKIMWEGELVTPSCGAPMRFHAALGGR